MCARRVHACASGRDKPAYPPSREHGGERGELAAKLAIIKMTPRPIVNANNPACRRCDGWRWRKKTHDENTNYEKQETGRTPKNLPKNQSSNVISCQTESTAETHAGNFCSETKTNEERR